MNIPVLIISYNNTTYVKSMVEQVQRFTSVFYVIDNASTFQPHIDYLKTIESHVIHMDKNYGHSVYYEARVWNLSGEKFIITDPDLLFNPNMPTNVIDILSSLSDLYRVNKVGLALDIARDIREDFRFESGQTIVEWESRFWTKPIPHDTYQLYDAPLDTTFCLFNKAIAGYSAIRIAGDFTCKHRPWYAGWEKELLPGELEAYRQHNTSSNYAKQSNLERSEMSMKMDPKYFSPAGKEHYRLLEHLTNCYSNRTIIDIGTYDGLSALALSTNPANTIISFDIEVKPGLPSKPNIQYSTDNLMTPEGRTKWKDVLLAAPFIFLDIDPHEGTREYVFYEWLRDNDYKGFVLCDDIWYFGAMVDNFWSKIPESQKIDVTYKGHWSGTGVIRLHPGEAEAHLNAFVDPQFNYGRSTLDMALKWHPTCTVAQRIRAEFYHVLQLELGDGVENYLTIGTPAYSLQLLKAQELLYETGLKSTHALLDGVPNGCAVFLLLISNPTLTIDCVCETVPPSIAYLNAQFGQRISIGRTRETYDLLHIDRPNPTEKVDTWKPYLTKDAHVVLAKWKPYKTEIDRVFAKNQLIWVTSTPTSLLAKNRRDSMYTPGSALPSVSNN